MIQKIPYSQPLITRPTLDEYITHLQREGRFTETVKESASKALQITKNNDIIFYIAGALTGMDEPTKARYVKISQCISLKKRMFGYVPHLHGTDPVEHPGVTPEEVRDIDFMFAVVIPNIQINCLYPIAHGNGIEAGWAEAAGIPALYVVPKEMRLSRLVRGMTNIIDTCEYDDFDRDALPAIESFLGTLGN